jgi:hypothetical protein
VVWLRRLGDADEGENSASALTSATKPLAFVRHRLPCTTRMWRRVRNTCVYLTAPDSK